MKGIIAPFDSMGLFSHVYKDRAGPNVLALLGNSLGNMSDDYGFLETLLASGMWPGDLLLLEVRCHVDEEAGQGPGMGEETKKRLNFGPLEILGASYEDHRDLISVRREHSRSVIPGTVTTVTRCEQVRCGGMTWRDVRLCYVHEYSEADLDTVLAEIGYTTVAKLHRGVRGRGHGAGRPAVPAAEGVRARRRARVRRAGPTQASSVVDPREAGHTSLGEATARHEMPGSLSLCSPAVPARSRRRDPPQQPLSHPNGRSRVEYAVSPLMSFFRSRKIVK